MSDDRIARFEARQAELAQLGDEELKARFWQLSEQMMTPVVELARTHTSPSIERSVLLRMGIDSISTHGVVDKCAEAGLLGKGAGHCVLKVAHARGVDIREAARLIIDEPAVLAGLFDDAPAPHAVDLEPPATPEDLPPATGPAAPGAAAANEASSASQKEN